MLLSCFIFVSILTTPTIAATYTECSAVPAMIPDTFSVTYQPSTLYTGTAYFTYVEPTWDNWPQFDIRELASNPYTANFFVQYTNQNFNFSDPTDLSNDCTFSTPQSYTRDNSWTAALVEVDGVSWLNLTFQQTGSLICTINAVETNVQGAQQFSVEGTLSVRSYTCDDNDVVNGTTTSTLDATSKVAMPSFYDMESCQRLTVTIGIEGQLTTKQLDRISQYITALATPTNTSITPTTLLHSYDLGTSYQHNGHTYYSNVISWCTFNGTLPTVISLPSLFTELDTNTQVNEATYLLSSSKMPSYCFDGILDFGESDIDCGGTGSLNGCAPCVDTSQICNGNTDCVSGECTAHELAGRRCATVNSSFATIPSMFIVLVLSYIAIIMM